MKLRYSSLDVKVIAQELSSSLLSLRISNIYDLSSRIFLFKCAKPGHKAQLLVDPGFRCHLTSFSRTAEPSPSAFVARLRKYLKTRRITGVTQVGTDRVIDITFSDGQYRLFLEFFAAGNIVLTDNDLNVLALWRQVSEGDEDVDVKLGSKYVLEAKQNYTGIPPLTKERITQVLETQVERSRAAQAAGGKKAKRQKGGDDLKKALSTGFPEFSSHLLDHIFTESAFDATKKPTDVLESEELLSSVMAALEKANQVYRNFEAGTQIQGYIIAKVKDSSSNDAPPEPSEPSKDTAGEALLYEDFHPFRPSQFENKVGVRILEYDGFNKTVDEFYSSIESQRLEGRLTEREEAAKKKLETAKNEHQKRLGALQQVQELHVRKAQAIEANTHRVEEAIAAVNGLIGQGMDWVDIGKLIENEQKRDNVVAQMIKLPLKLEENTVTLLLSEPGAEFDDDEEDDEADETDSEAESDDEDNIKANASAARIAEKRLAIDIDLASSPWANARQYYEQRKSAAVKEQKTMQAADRALKSMEKKTEADLKKGLKTEKAGLRPARRQFWFEKFLYFISSDGYLVIGGKDATQNELLYRRYLKRGDIYVHADLHGASSVIVKNNPTTPDAPVPPSTLSQAGSLTVCTSSAWDSKAVMAAWWVEAHQVSKTAPTGEYIKTGGFMIKGKKNFLPPAQLVLGFGVLWQISDASRANHGKHRIQRTESMVDGEAEALAADAQGLSIEEPVEEDGVEQAHDEAVPDVEDVAEDAVKEIEEDEAAGNASDEDDRASTVASEVGQSRANPLQLNNNQNGKDDNDNTADERSDEDQDSEEDGSEPEEDNKERDKSQSAPNSSAKQQSQSKARPKRGANTKAKRAAQAKYALQTDEEREMAMSLLGSTKGQHKKESEEVAKAAREEKARLDKERRKQQHERAAEAERKRMERLEKGELGEGALNDEDEMDAEQAELERKELMNIDLLVPYPEPGDELVAAIPVVAPWTAMARTKYKVKLQPGSVKKGKLIKEVLGNWTALASKGPRVVDESNKDKEKVWSREIELMKLWKAEEIVGVIPVKGCRVVQSGGLGAGGGAAHNGRGKGNPARGGKGKKR